MAFRFDFRYFQKQLIDFFGGFSATPPTNGQVATYNSTSGKTEWQNPTGGGSPETAPYLTVGNDGTLSNERAITMGTGLSATDGGANSTYTISVLDNATNQKVKVSKAGSLIGTRRNINLIEGSNVTLTVSDNAGNDRVDVTVESSSGGVTDHGALTGLSDDDHTQYHNDSRALTWLGGRSTSDLPEGSNLYYTASRFNTAFSGKTTSDLSEGSNLYYTSGRFDTAFGTKDTDDLAEGATSRYYSSALFDTDFSGKDTGDLAEGSNLYYTDERVDDRVAALLQNGTGISWSYNDAGGTLTPTVSLSGFSTTNLSEGSNLYFTDERVDDRVSALIQNGTGISWSYNDGAGTLTPTVSLSGFSTTNLSEGSNLYFTDERAQDAVGGALVDSSTIDFTYTDGSNQITAIVIDDSISNAKLRNSGALSIIGRSANSTGDPADISASAASDAVLRESGSTLGFGTIATGGIANNAVTYAKIQDISATQRVVGRNTGGSGDAEEVTASQVLDWIGSTRGSVLYRGASGWAVLTPGTSGHVLTSNGAGADPSYQAAAGGGAPTDAQYVTLATNGTLTNERVLTGTANQVTVTDNGAGSTVVLSTPQDLATTSNVQFGQAALIPTASINNPPYSFLIDEATTNLLTNPSFETNTTGWATHGSNASISRVTTQKFSGDASLEIVISPATASSGAQSSTISCNPSTTYVISLWAKTTSGTVAMTFGLSGNNSGFTGANATVTTEWKRFTISKTTNGSDSTIQAIIRTQTSQAVTWYVDAVQVEQKDSGLPSTYCDGSLGAGYSWSGTAHGSTSSRTAGAHFLAPPASGENKLGLVLKPDGTLGDIFNKFETNAGLAASGQYGFEFTGNIPTLSTLGISAAIVKIENEGAGEALRVKSGVTYDAGMIIETPSITSGVALAIAAPSDKSGFTGEYFKFLDKSNKDDWKFSKNRLQMGVPAENLDKYFRLYGGGKFASATTGQSGTVAWSGTTVTGTGTTFTNHAIGDIIEVSGQRGVIQAIGSNTSITTQNAASPAISAGASYATVNSQYSPPVLFIEQPGSDHRVAQKASLFKGLWFTESGHLKIKDHKITAGSSTLTTTSGSTSFTTAANDANIAAGDFISAAGLGPVQVYSYAAGSGQFRTAASASVAAVSYTIHEADDATYPTSDNDTRSRWITARAFSDGPKSISSTTSETSIFNTTPTIMGGMISKDRGLRIKAFGTCSGSGTLLIALKLGSTTICANSTAESLTSGSGFWELECMIVAVNSSNSDQRNLIKFTKKLDGNNQATDDILATQTSSVNMGNDQTLDITFDSANATGIATEVYSIIGEWI